MAENADNIPASDGQFALKISDLNTSVNHEPRVEDLRLAEALGMDRPRDIRKLIERHCEALGRLGAFCATVAQNTDSKGRGRPGRTFWLNKRQCLYLCTKSETARATEATIQMVEVFDAHLAGTLAATVAVKRHRRALPKPRPAQAPPNAAFAPRLDHDGFAVIRIAGETLVVDLMRVEPRRAGRAVTIGWDAAIGIEDLTEARSNARFLGDRNVTLPDPTAATTGRRSLWIVGGVIASQPATAPGEGMQEKANRRSRGEPRRRSSLPYAARPDLTDLAVHGSA